MARARVLGARVPGDLTGTALGIAIHKTDIDGSLRAGLRLVGETMPTLAAKAHDITNEIDSPDNPLRNTSSRLVRIDREVSASDLEHGKLVVLGCDARKVLALLGALQIQHSARALELRDIVISAVKRGGIPLTIEGAPRIGGSIFIRVFQESVEIALARTN